MTDFNDMPAPQQSQAQAMGVAPAGNAASSGLGAQLQGLLSARQQIDSQIATTLPSAVQLVKTPGTTQGQVPAAYTFGVNPPKFAPPVSRSDAKSQGIAKIVSAVGGLVATKVKQNTEQKQRALATDIQRVMTAQDGISEATARLKANPDDKDAKALIEKNKQIINDTIGADPKKLKQFEKAFDINFLDPSKNDKDEHGALKLATKSYADQLEAKTPEKMAPNVAAQQKIQILSAQAQALDSQVKALMPAYNEQQREEARSRDVQVQQEEANKRSLLREEGENQRKEAELQQRQQDTELRFKEVQATNQTRYGVAAMQAKAAMDRTMQVLNTRQKIADGVRTSKPGVAGKIDEQNAALIQKQMNQIPQQIANIEQIRKNADPSQVEGYDKTIQYLEAQQKQYAAMLTQYAKENMNMPPEEQKGGTKDATSSSNGARTTVTPIGNSEDDTEDGDPTDPDSDYYK